MQNICANFVIEWFEIQPMTDNALSPKVDGYLRKHKEWRQEFEQLRRIVLDCQLTEDFKWMHPCYTLEGKNIVLIQDFKHYCALLFPKGALLKDPRSILVAMTENTQAARQIRFTSVGDIVGMETVLKDYIHEAVEVEKAGLKWSSKRQRTLQSPKNSRP